MRQLLVEPKSGRKHLIVSVHPNTDHCFVSASGKSLVYRIKGSYIDKKGYFYFKSDDSISPYLNSRLDLPNGYIVPNSFRRKIFSKSSFFKHEFEKFVPQDALRIELSKNTY